MGYCVVRCQFESLMISADGVVPGFGMGEFVTLLPVSLRRLGRDGRGRGKTQDKRGRHGQKPVQVKKRIPPAAFHRTRLARVENPGEARELRALSARSNRLPIKLCADLPNPR